MRIVGVNGINTNGEGNVDVLLHRMAALGYETVDVRLPKRRALSALWGGKSDGELIAAASQDGDILVAHSFGGVRAFFAHRKMEYKHIILIAPAHSRNAQWYNPRRVTCYFSPSDWIIRLGASLPFHPFGNAGSMGYYQDHVTNISCRGAGHNDYFKGELLHEICARIHVLASQ